MKLFLKMGLWIVALTAVNVVATHLILQGWSTVLAVLVVGIPGGLVLALLFLAVDALFADRGVALLEQRLREFESKE